MGIQRFRLGGLSNDQDVRGALVRLGRAGDECRSEQGSCSEDCAKKPPIGPEQGR